MLLLTLATNRLPAPLNQGSWKVQSGGKGSWYPFGVSLWILPEPLMGNPVVLPVAGRYKQIARTVKGKSIGRSNPEER